jgi:hypothetical protein
MNEKRCGKTEGKSVRERVSEWRVRGEKNNNKNRLAFWMRIFLFLWLHDDSLSLRTALL